jgi:hypothetical protein
MLSVAREPLSLQQLIAVGQLNVEWGDITEAIAGLRPFLETVNGCYRLYHTSLAEFLIAPSTASNADICDLYQQPDLCHKQFVSAFESLVQGWHRPQWEQLDDYGWRHMIAHASLSGEDSGQLIVDICDNGFLQAKQRQRGQISEIQDDWGNVLRVVRECSRFADYVRFGLDRSRASHGLYLLHIPAVADAAIRIALEKDCELNITELVEQSELVSPIESQLSLKVCLYDRLFSISPNHPALARILKGLLQCSAFLARSKQCEVFAAEIADRLVVAGHPKAETFIQSRLEECESPDIRAGLRSTLAREYARRDRRDVAAQMLHDTLNELDCRDFDEDSALDYMQVVLRVERVSKAQLLHASLVPVLQAAGSLRAPDCRDILSRVCCKALTIPDGTFGAYHYRLGIAVGMLEPLSEAGLRDEAIDCALSLLRPHGLIGLDRATKPKTELLSGWLDLVKKCEGHFALQELLALTYVVAFIDDQTVESAWRLQVYELLAQLGWGQELTVITEQMWQLAESPHNATVLRAVYGKLLPYALREGGEVGF